MALIGCRNDASSEGFNESSSTSPPQPVELRGVWLTNVDSDVLNSRAKIVEAVQFLADHHFNVVFPVVWNNAYTLYPSAVMDSLLGYRIDPQYAGRDPLAELIEAAHEHGLAVMPWFEFGFAASYQASGGPIIEAKPEWAARDRGGALLTKNGFEWMNAYHPAVQDFLQALVLEVVRTYDVDGVQGDDRLNGFAERLCRAVKAVDPALQVSWAPSIYPWGYDEYLHD